MSYTARAKLTVALSGSTEGGQLGPISLQKIFDNQDAHDQIIVSVEAGDTLKMIDLANTPQAVGLKQTFFGMFVSGAPVNVRINGKDDMTFALADGGMWMVGGLPTIDTLEFTSLSTVESKISIAKLYGPSTLVDPAPPGPPPGGFFSAFENIGPAVAAQTAFTLPSTPADVNRVMFFVDGVMYSVASGEISVVGTALTWNDISFVMTGGERCEALY